MRENAKVHGWKNYETWNVALWAGNDEGIYREIRRRRPARDYTEETAQELAREIWPDGTPDFQDMGGAKAFDAVDWEEVADAWNEF